MKMCRVAAGALLATVASGPAIAAQCATVTFSPGTVAVPNYDPIAGAEAQASFTATIARVSPATTSVRLIFADSDNSTLPARLGVAGTTIGPRYQILDPSGVNVALPLSADVLGARNAKISLAAGAPGDAVSVSYLLDLLPNVPARDYQNGSYGETLTYSVECFQGLILQASDTRVTGPNLSVTIPNLVSLTTASAATLDFENFTTLTQQLNVGLKSTGPINVDLRTANQRRMVLAGAPSPAPLNSYIAYSITLNGRPVSQDPYILTNAPRAGVAGRTWPLKLTLRDQPSGKLAGSYSDTITLTVTPGN